MSLKKKSRKVGRVGVRSTPKHERQHHHTVKNVTKRKGRPAGSRQAVQQTNIQEQDSSQQRDSRIGSKKPIALVSTQSPNEFDLQQELQQLEQNEKLQDCLDLLDAGETLPASTQSWFEATMSRYEELLERLGIDLDEDED